MLISCSTPGVPSEWNRADLKTYSFKPQNQVTYQPTKDFKKPSLNKDEQLHFFKKFFLSQLKLDQKLENLKINLISSDFFNLPHCFDLLSDFSSEITPKSLSDIVNLSLQDCETFLYCFQ